MKAWQIDRFGLDALRSVELPDPQPGAGEVLVRWRAQSLNYRDLVIVKGTYLPNLPLPFTPLSDASGEVVALGAGVTAWKAGDRVIGQYIQSWLDGPPTLENTRLSLGAPLPGVLSEYSVIPDHGSYPCPTTFPSSRAPHCPSLLSQRGTPSSVTAIWLQARPFCSRARAGSRSSACSWPMRPACAL